MPENLLQPNPATGRVLYPSFFNDLMTYHEDLVASYQPHGGLLPAGNKHVQPLAEFEPPDLIRLNSIHTIGERGHLISADPSKNGPSIKPFDCHKLPVGQHSIYACLTSEKVPCGEAIEINHISSSSNTTLQKGSQQNRIVLLENNRRFDARDWIKVSELERIRSGGTIKTEINKMYHPPIFNMKAYCSFNPMLSFIQQVSEQLDSSELTIEKRLLRAELSALKTIAVHGSPYFAFAQFQKCLELLACVPEFSNHSALFLRDYAFMHNTFCEFLAKLHECLESQSHKLYPDILQINDVKFHRLDGEFIEDGDFWKWDSYQENFVANALAIYFPKIEINTIPNIRYGTQMKGQNQFAVAKNAKKLNGPGSAIVFDDIKGEIEHIFISTNALQYFHRLRMQLGEGHAIYYR